MIFRTIIHDGGATVTVEDDGSVLFAVAVAGRSEATALVKRAVRDGYETIRPPVVEVPKAKKRR